MDRRKDIDAYRGLGILLVVLGHVSYLSPYWIKVIYGFHMPAFFILSGFLLNTNNYFQGIPSFIKNRFYRLIIPAWCIGMICGIPFVVMLLIGHLSLSEFCQKLVGTLTGATKVDKNFFVTPIWFLYCLFIIEVLFCFIFILSKNKLVITIASFLLFFVGVCFKSTSLLNFNIALIAIPYFTIGYLLKDITIPKSGLVAFFAGAVILVMPFITPEGVDFSAQRIGSEGWLFANFATALLGCYLLYFISGFINSNAIAWLGKNTLIILGFNYYINAFVKILLKIVKLENYVLISFAIQILLFAVMIKFISYWPAFDSLINGRSFLQIKKQNTRGY